MYYTNFYINVYKNGQIVDYKDYNDLPDEMVKQLNALNPDDDELYGDEEEYTFCDLHEERSGAQDQSLINLSSQYPDYEFLIREFDQDVMRYDYFKKGEHIQVVASIPIPEVIWKDGTVFPQQ